MCFSASLLNANLSLYRTQGYHPFFSSFITYFVSFWSILLPLRKPATSAIIPLQVRSFQLLRFFSSFAIVLYVQKHTCFYSPLNICYVFSFEDLYLFYKFWGKKKKKPSNLFPPLFFMLDLLILFSRLLSFFLFPIPSSVRTGYLLDLSSSLPVLSSHMPNLWFNLSTKLLLSLTAHFLVPKDLVFQTYSAFFSVIFPNGFYIFLSQSIILNILIPQLSYIKFWGC